MICYSIALSLLFLAFIFIAGSFNYRPLLPPLLALPLVILALIIAVAETNRAPFDLPEAESELVAYSVCKYSLIAPLWLFN
jgi:NADH:ubiquinone oxidoreductase subunit H